MSHPAAIASAFSGFGMWFGKRPSPSRNWLPGVRGKEANYAHIHSCCCSHATVTRVFCSTQGVSFGSYMRQTCGNLVLLCTLAFSSRHVQSLDSNLHSLIHLVCWRLAVSASDEQPLALLLMSLHNMQK